MPDIVALGEPLIEFNQARADEPSSYLQGFGGDTSNMAIAAARLGASVAYATRLGGDAFGRMFVDLWKREGVDTEGVALDAEAPTGVYFVTHGPAGHEFSYLRAGSAASRMTPSQLPVALLRSARLVHASGISQAISASACDSVFAAFEIARDAGALVSYDPNVRRKLWPLARAKAVVMATIAMCTWCLPSEEDAVILFGDAPADALVDALHRAGARGVVLKRGRAGCIVSDGAHREAIDARRVASVDATGAGDCFDGAFAARLMAGDDAFTAARYANVAAALATTGFGAVAPLPRASDVEQAMKAP
jgi:2-dehydro-3-deoxygluconokinase